MRLNYELGGSEGNRSGVCDQCNVSGRFGGCGQ